MEVFDYFNLIAWPSEVLFMILGNFSDQFSCWVIIIHFVFQNWIFFLFLESLNLQNYILAQCGWSLINVLLNISILWRESEWEKKLYQQNKINFWVMLGSRRVEWSRVEVPNHWNAPWYRDLKQVQVEPSSLHRSIFNTE